MSDSESDSPIVLVSVAAVDSGTNLDASSPNPRLSHSSSPVIHYDYEKGTLIGMQFNFTLHDFEALDFDTPYELVLLRDSDFGIENGSGRWMLSIVQKDGLIFNEEMTMKVMYDGAIDDPIPVTVNCILKGFRRINNKELSFSSGCVVKLTEQRKYVSRIFPIDTTLRRRNVTDGSLEFSLTISFSSCPYTEKFMFSSGSDTGIAQNTSKRTQEMMSAVEFSDFKITLSDGTGFPVHRVILAAGSPVFKAMFTTDMEERRNGCVEIMGAAKEPFEVFLKYLYGFNVLEDFRSNPKVCEDVLKIADKYQVDDLRTLCTRYLENNITVDNALNILILSDRLKNETMEQCAMDFIARNYTSLKSATDFETVWQPEENVFKRLLDFMGKMTERGCKRSASEADLD